MVIMGASNGLNNNAGFIGSKLIDTKLLNKLILRSGYNCSPTDRDTICPDITGIPEITLSVDLGLIKKSSSYLIGTNMDSVFRVFNKNNKAYKGSDLVKYNNFMTSLAGNGYGMGPRFINRANFDYHGADGDYLEIGTISDGSTAAAFAGANAGYVSEDNTVGVVGNVDY